MSLNLINVKALKNYQEYEYLDTFNVCRKTIIISVILQVLNTFH